MHRLHRGPLAVAILAATLTTDSVLAQSRPELSDLRTAARIRLPELSASAATLPSDTATRSANLGERLGFAAIFTAVGAGLGYSWWHTCNDPESDVIWSCIVAPRRLGSSVRFGAYSGLAVGLAGLVGDLRVKRHIGVRAAGPDLLIDHRARGGFRLGLNFRF